MNLAEIMGELDRLYQEENIPQVQALLEEKVRELRFSGEIFPRITLLNELLGIYRETQESVLGTSVCEELLGLFRENSLKKDENYGTTLLNIATAHRAFGDLFTSKKYYEEALDIFQNTIPETDYRFASLYNNMSLLYMEQGNLDSALENLQKSLGILAEIPHTEVQIATGNTSMAQIFLEQGKYAEARTHLTLALNTFETIPDFHYSAALGAQGDLEFLEKHYEKSLSFYEKAMEEVEKYLGQGETYQYFQENCDLVRSRMKGKGLELCKRYYEAEGAPMIARLFPQYQEQIAVGLVGAGSECYGFDDELSTDHDFFPRFCLWLPHDLYLEIGMELQRAYDELPKEFEGYSRPGCCGEKRDGVFSIPLFYQEVLGIPHAPQEENHWFALEESQLAEASNGEVFHDPLGEFSQVRKDLLGYYPKGVLRQKLGQQAHVLAQTGQYNLARSVKRGDTLTASLVLWNFVEASLDMLCLLNARYAPYYKWKVATCKELEHLPDTLGKLEKLQECSLENPQLLEQIEEICGDFVGELKRQGYIEHIKAGNFLDDYVKELLQ